MLTKTVTAICLAFSPMLAIAQVPPGSIALYPLNNSANDVSGNGYNGTLTSTTSATNRFGTAGSATGFTAGTSTGTLPNNLVVAMQDDFSIGYWFNSTMTAPSSSQWYGGAALVDAEVCGGTSDWGTALINGGSVAFGIGNPDITVISPGTTYNDGNWHFVVATRAESAGTITLYIDGAQVATTSGTATTARTAPSIIGLGRNNCVATGVYTGSLDDAIAYARVLSSTEVSNLYNYYSGIALPLTWIGFTGEAEGGAVLLRWQTADAAGNDHFEIDRSTDGSHFSDIGMLPNADDMVTGPGVQSYQFTDPNPLQGNNFYRIKQIDADGRYSYSRVVEVNVGRVASGFQLQTNPARSEVTLLNAGQQTVEMLQVLDVSGRAIINAAPNSSHSLINVDVSGLRPGYYLLRVGTRDGVVSMPFMKY
ncbi:MAG TPA: LamG-like jellyroll fold domain-containing protein [Puia sp.]|nr:LamG-like jellyroll fold domain-containing protein [Puia sp.]